MSKTIKVVKKVPDEDSDVIPESPEVRAKDKKKQSRRKRVISDLDEEIASSSKKYKSNHKSEKSTSKISPVKTEVKAINIFSRSPIKRSDPLVKKTKKKTESGIHSDDEFEKSLLEIDQYEEPQTNKLSNNHYASKKESPEIDKNKNNEKEIQNTSIRDTKRKAKENSNGDIDVNNLKIKKEEQRKENRGKDFREFLDDDSSKVENGNNKTSKVTTNVQKKQILDKSLNESVLSDEERHERKRYSAALYQKYLNRTGPKNLGSKEIPEGAADCLKDCVFLLTGVLDSFERDEVIAAVTQYGGVVKSGISKKITHVVAGEDAGPAKLAKAQEMGVKILNEDEFLQMIASSVNVESKKDIENVKKRKKSPNEKQKDKALNGATKRDAIVADIKKERKSLSPKEPAKVTNTVSEDVKPKVEAGPNDVNKNTQVAASLMWVDKYKPQNLKQIIGQHGDASNVKKLTNWLTKWYSNRKMKLPKPSPWAKGDDGGYYKAALLSGPPGVGKTTTVSLVCKELGFDVVEFNASDTRSKNLIREQIGELLTTTSLSGYAKGMTGKGAVTRKHVLVMDEVDGMAGNEDRGGLQELIALIKSTCVPIVCMCNDRQSDKMRTLVNYCYDLRFSRPRVDQIKAAMMSICYKEGLKVPADVMSQLITAAGQDVRQVLHLLSMWAVDEGAGADADRKRETKMIKKDVKMGPWEAVRRVFAAAEHRGMSVGDKSDLFFADYSLMPLFVQENYLSVVPTCTNSCSKREVLERVSEAANSISVGDLVDARIRRSQAWTLLPIQAMYSSVIPGHHMAGHVGAQIQFPGWLGRNSRASRLQRLAQQIHAHARLSTSGSKSSIFLDYAPHLRDAIVNPLIKDRTDGIQDSLNLLESYHLLREDLESLTEISLWPGQTNPTVLIDAKVKAAMTRTYNKKAAALPYAPGSIKKGRAQEDDGDENQVDEEQNDDSDPENDALIKKKKKETDKPGSSKAKSTVPKEKKKKK